MTLYDKFVKKYEVNHRVRKFPCYVQIFCLAYAQLTYRESLRDIETCLNAHPRYSDCQTGLSLARSREKVSPDLRRIDIIP